jgi:hypothetical protein
MKRPPVESDLVCAVRNFYALLSIIRVRGMFVKGVFATLRVKLYTL